MIVQSPTAEFTHSTCHLLQHSNNPHCLLGQQSPWPGCQLILAHCVRISDGDKQKQMMDLSQIVQETLVCCIWPDRQFSTHCNWLGYDNFCPRTPMTSSFSCCACWWIMVDWLQIDWQTAWSFVIVAQISILQLLFCWKQHLLPCVGDQYIQMLCWLNNCYEVITTIH